MRRAPCVVVSSSSDSSDSDELNGAFQNADWAVLRLNSFDSVPFSDVPHAPYGMESTFLSSCSVNVSHGNGGPGSVRPEALLGFRSPKPAETMSPRTGVVSISTHPDVFVRRTRQQKKRRSMAPDVAMPKWRESEHDMNTLLQREVAKGAGALEEEASVDVVRSPEPSTSPQPSAISRLSTRVSAARSPASPSKLSNGTASSSVPLASTHAPPPSRRIAPVTLKPTAGGDEKKTHHPLASPTPANAQTHQTPNGPVEQSGAVELSQHLLVTEVSEPTSSADRWTPWSATAMLSSLSETYHPRRVSHNDADTSPVRETFVSTTPTNRVSRLQEAKNSSAASTLPPIKASPVVPEKPTPTSALAPTGGGARKDEPSKGVPPRLTSLLRPEPPSKSADQHPRSEQQLKLSASDLMAPSRDAGPTSRRPTTRQFVTESGASSAVATPPKSPPASHAAAEKLIAFVKAVSDPEVLHVVHDYLVEKKTGARFKMAAKVCGDLLKRKEELLQGADSPLSPRKRRLSSSTHRREPVPLLDSPHDNGWRSSTVTKSPMSTVSNGMEDGEDPDADEFEDFNYFPSPYPASSTFSFSEPSVSGSVTRVFAEGMLYKIKTAKGEYHFFNDTLQDVMMVRVQCVLRGNEQINDRAMLTPIEGSNETEITIAVLPEETNFFISGVGHLPHVMAKRVPVPPEFVSPSVTASLRKINAGINSVRSALGQWSRASDQHSFLKCCLKNNLKFTDLNFRPMAESLYRADVDRVVIPGVTWRRPSEYVCLTEISQTRLFRGEISCFLVKQGELSDHTVVAAMAAVAQYPDHIRWMFRHPVSAHVGKMERGISCYRVTLIHNGWWATQLIDDYVPASQKGPLFAQCPEDPRRVWVPLLEKAYAKSLGSYAALCEVDVIEALSDFTGFPIRFLDQQWAAAKLKPTEAVSNNLFKYLQKRLQAGCMVLLFTPSPGDKQSDETLNLSRKRSSRMMPVKGIVPNFLPGHVYFIRDAAHYQELDLRMVQLKNPWTWETKNKTVFEKKWKYTTWYDRPDMSLSATPSQAGLWCSSGSPPPSMRSRLSGEAAALNDRKGTMWLEWGEVLKAFAGGGVCYTLWNWHRYRAKNSFVVGRPTYALELRAKRKVEVIATLSQETVDETLDNYGAVISSHPTPLCATAMAVLKMQPNGSTSTISQSCEDIECFAGRRTYVEAKDISMKLTVDPTTANGGPILLVPLIDPGAVGDKTLKPAATPQRSTPPPPPQVRFVLSLVTDTAASADTGFSIRFVALPRDCPVYDGSSSFKVPKTSPVEAEYQICNDMGVTTAKGSSILEVVDQRRTSDV